MQPAFNKHLSLRAISIFGYNRYMLSLERQNEFRERYRLQNPGWQPATELYADWVRQHIQPTTHLLDLGCGRGGLVEQLGHPLEFIVGVDADPQSLREHRLTSLPRAAAVADALPFQAASFDLAFSSWLLEHLPNPAHTLHEIGRILRPNGRFIFITPNKRHPLAFLNLVAGRWGSLQSRLVERFYGRAATDTFPTWYRANTAADLHYLASQSKLTLLRLETIPDPSYLAFTSSMFKLASFIDQQLLAHHHIHLVGILQKAC